MKMNHASKQERMDPAPKIIPGNPWIDRLDTPAEDVLDTGLHLVHLPGFHVCDADSANWVVRKIVECRPYAERAKAYAAAEVARAEREERFFRWRYGPQLEAWFDRERECGDRPGPPRKSLNLPAVTIGRRACNAKLEVLDADSVMTWARVHCPDGHEEGHRLAHRPGLQARQPLHRPTQPGVDPRPRGRPHQAPTRSG